MGDVRPGRSGWIGGVIHTKHEGENDSSLEGVTVVLRIELSKAKPGMMLALPLHDPSDRGRILLKIGYELDRAMLERLSGMDVRSIWIRYPSLDVLGKYVDEAILESQGELVRLVTQMFACMQESASVKINYGEYCQTVSGLIRDLITNPTAAVFMGDLIDDAQADGSELLRHASSVAYLSVLMGLKLEGYLVRERRHIDPSRAKEVRNLGIGAMLHDVGVAQLDSEVRSRYFATGDDSDLSWREHTTLGYKLVRGKVEPSAATCVLNHHQRFDGSGYTGQGMPLLEGDRIHIFARIVGLADAFDRMRYPIGRPARPTVFALHRLLVPEVFQQFDPQALRALFAVTPPYPPGAMLRLSDGRYAVTIDHQVSDPCRPVVQPMPAPMKLSASSSPEEDEDVPVDLSDGPGDLRVVECDGVDVSAYFFEAPELMKDCSSVRAWL